MIDAVDFQMRHLEGFTPKEGFVNFDIKQAKHFNMHNPSRELVSLLSSGETVAILGLNVHKPGVGELWLIPSPLVDEYKFEFFKATRKLIYNYVFPVLQMRRLTIAIDASWEKGCKWAEKLGFEKESVMKGFGDNYEDHICYAKVV